MAAVQIKSVRWYHDRIIDLMLTTEVPLSQNEIAKLIGYSASWVSIMVNSDAFKERLAERKAELTDPVLAASINDRLDALARRSLDKLLDRLDQGVVKTGELIAMAKLGVGDKNTRPAAPAVNTNNMYVVQLPPPAPSTQIWLENAQKSSQTRPPQPVEIVEVVSEEITENPQANTTERVLAAMENSGLPQKSDILAQFIG